MVFKEGRITPAQISALLRTIIEVVKKKNLAVHRFRKGIGLDP